jgi:hypothetical protein
LYALFSQSRAALIGLITNTIVDKKVKDFGLVLAQMTPIKTLLFFDAFYAYLQLRSSSPSRSSIKANLKSNPTLFLPLSRVQRESRRASTSDIEESIGISSNCAHGTFSGLV